MTRRAPDPEPGIRAYFTGPCPMCDELIIKGKSRIFAKHGIWRHCHHASGADE